MTAIDESGRGVNQKVEELALELLELPTASRALLARKLISSLDDDWDYDEKEVERLWLEEAERRMNEARENGIEGRDGKEVIRELNLRFPGNADKALA